MCRAFTKPCHAPFRKPPLAQEHSETSKAAAVKVERARESIQRMIWNFLAAHEDGRTTDEVCIALGLEGNTVRPRLLELEEQGRAERVTQNGQPHHPILNPAVRTRENAKGNKCQLWRAVR